jgi:hypothetical protein
MNKSIGECIMVVVNHVAAEQVIKEMNGTKIGNATIHITVDHA